VIIIILLFLGDAYDVTYYFTSCMGINPFQSDLTNAQDTVNTLQNDIKTLMTIDICSTALNQLTLSLDETYKMDTTLNQIESSLNCSIIQSYYKDVFNDDICKDLFTGIYITWLSFYSSFALLFILTFLIWYKKSKKIITTTTNVRNENISTTPLLTTAYIANADSIDYDNISYIDNNRINVIASSTIFPPFHNNNDNDNNQNPNFTSKNIHQNPLNSIHNPSAASLSNLSSSQLSGPSAPLITEEDDYDDYFNSNHTNNTAVSSVYENYDHTNNNTAPVSLYENYGLYENYDQ